jgi:GT2 family glycosyltransferase
MKLIVAIPTVGRKGILSKTLAHLECQTRLHDEIIIVAPDASDVEPFQSDVLNIKVLFGRRGLTLQRNLAIDHACDRCDVLTFFDDDFLAAADYIEQILRAFKKFQFIDVVTGNVIMDGISGPGLSYEDGAEAIKNCERDSPSEEKFDVVYGAYGCNMSVRTNKIGALRFDERLVLYGWQEDIDFTRRLASEGRIVKLHSARGVHLGAKSGRISGVRFGYSQIANPVYLVRKGSFPLKKAATLISKNIIANVWGSVWPEPWIDRRGRLRGNLLAAAHILARRVEPEHILKL